MILMRYANGLDTNSCQFDDVYDNLTWKDILSRIEFIHLHSFWKYWFTNPQASEINIAI